MFSPRWCYQFAFGALCFTALISQTSALTQEYCSSINTASTPKNSSIYQSNGLCHDFCLSSYAFAIVQGDGCWCSDYAPATTTSGCVNVCPGYPLELCGGNGVYAYIALENVAPSGTEGASAAASTSSTSISAAAQVTVTATPPAVTVIETPATSSESSISSSSSSSTSSPPVTTSEKSSSSSTWTPTPTLSLETLTGVVHTVTVTPTSPPNASSAAGITSDNKKIRQGQAAMAMQRLSSSSPLLNGQSPGIQHIFTYSKNERRVQKWACHVKIGGASKHWRCKYIIRNALPDVTTTMMTVFVVGAATTVLVNQTKTKRLQPKQNTCESCNGSGICGECNGDGFILKKLSKDASDRARKNAKDAATRYTAGLPKKWNYCSKCSGSQRCLVCNGRGTIQEI